MIEELYHSVFTAKRTHKQSTVNVRRTLSWSQTRTVPTEEYLSLVEKGEAVTLLGQATGTDKKRLMRHWSDVHCSFSFVKLKCKSAVAKKKRSGDDLKSSLEKVSGAGSPP